MAPVALLVPLKDFGDAKGRLGEALPDRERESLMRELAAGVLAAGEGLRRWVVCDRPAVAGFALQHGAQVIWRGGGLNVAVQAAIQHLATESYARVVIAHGDLAGVSTFDRFVSIVDDRTVTVAADRLGDGTNVMSLPVDLDFEVAYGPGSLSRHRAEAARLDVCFDLVEGDDFALDVDTIEDLNLYRSSSRAVRLT